MKLLGRDSTVGWDMGMILYNLKPVYHCSRENDFEWKRSGWTVHNVYVSKDAGLDSSMRKTK